MRLRTRQPLRCGTGRARAMAASIPFEPGPSPEGAGHVVDNERRDCTAHAGIAWTETCVSGHAEGAAAQRAAMSTIGPRGTWRHGLGRGEARILGENGEEEGRMGKGAAHRGRRMQMTPKVNYSPTDYFVSVEGTTRLHRTMV